MLIYKKTGIFLFAAIILGAGLASAQTNIDPMAALMGRTGGSDPRDPMSAFHAQVTDHATAEGNAEFARLPDGLGAEETYYQCVACHSVEIIKQQRISDSRWDELWTWMVEQQGMVAPDDDTKQVILTYLKENFSSER